MPSVLVSVDGTEHMFVLTPCTPPREAVQVISSSPPSMCTVSPTSSTQAFRPIPFNFMPAVQRAVPFAPEPGGNCSNVEGVREGGDAVIEDSNVRS